MGESARLMRDVVKNGVIVRAQGTVLPEGTRIEFRLDLLSEDIAEPDELVGWEKPGDEAWSEIDWGHGELARDSG